MTRRSPARSIVALLALLSMLCMQLAVAAYVCPGMTAATDVPLASQSMSNCEDMDLQQPVLCHTHASDQGSKQMADQPQLPDVPDFIASQLLLVVQPLLVQALPDRIAPSSNLLAHATAPPLAIQHCCFRI